MDERAHGLLRDEPGKHKMMGKQREVLQVWGTVSAQLRELGFLDLAGKVQHFAEQMLPPRTEAEILTSEALIRVRKLREPATARSR